jgi:hypothetical protein
MNRIKETSYLFCEGKQSKKKKREKDKRRRIEEKDKLH